MALAEANVNHGFQMSNIKMNEKESRQTITVLGTGDFSCALTKRLSFAGYDVVIGSRDPGKRAKCSHLMSYKIVSLGEALDHSNIIFFAVPHDGYDQMVSSLGSKIEGKIFVDVSNRTEAYDGGSSHAEYLAKLAPTAHVVKGFNVISAWALENDVYGGSKMVYLCGDNAEAKEKVMQIARTMQFVPIDQGSLQVAQSIEEKPHELFPSWRAAMAMFGVLYLIMWLYFVLKRVIKKSDFTDFPLKRVSLINAFTVIGLLDMVYLPGCIAALLQLIYGTKYRRFPKWLDIWMKSRKQLGLLALLLAAMHGCMSTLYWAPEYKSRLYQDKSLEINNISIPNYGKMRVQGEAFLTLGVLGLTSLAILGVTSLPTVLNRMSWREWNFVQSGLGYFALICALLHFTIFVYEGLGEWKEEHFFYPTVLVVIFGYATVFFKLVLLIPCLDQRVKKIRAGWERGTLSV